MRHYFQALLLLSLFLLSNAFAQLPPELDSRQIISDGVEMHDRGHYDSAITKFKQINPSDTNYVLAGYEMANSYVAQGKDSIALPILEQLLTQSTSFYPNLLAMKGNVLDDLKRYDEAIKTYKEGMEKYPLNYSFTYELGLLYFRQEKYLEATKWLEKSLQVNPYHSNTHLQLAKLALKEGKFIPAMLAYQFFLITDNSTAQAQGIISTLEKMSRNELEVTTPSSNIPITPGDDFSELEALVKSKVALGKKYKAKTHLKFNLTKQIQLILEKITVDKNDPSVFMQFYAKFFSEIQRNNYLEAYTYYILSGAGNQDVDKWVKSHKKEQEAFVQWCVKYIADGISYFEDDVNGTRRKVHHYYSNSNQILGAGENNAEKQHIGYWVYYFRNGAKKSEGNFENGNRTGEWKFYYGNGSPSAIEHNLNGQLEGEQTDYLLNGSPSAVKHYKNGKLEGEQALYYSNGVKRATYTYSNDLQNGLETIYYKNGATNYSINVVNGKYQGDFLEYYMDGHVKQKGAFKDGERTGDFAEYYDYPENTKKVEAHYSKGVIQGEYKSYYKDGKMEEIGTYNEQGEKNGAWTTYSRSQVKVGEENYVKGKITGTTKHFTSSGKLSQEFIYKNDMLQEYRAYDTVGKIIYQNRKDGKSDYSVLLYYSNGNKEREGRVEKGVFEGEWKYYNENGQISSKLNYSGGKQEGTATYYYLNGSVKQVQNYANGSLNGLSTEYWTNGKVKSEVHYVNGNEEGEWKGYYPDGKLKWLTFYKNGNFYNGQTFFNADGRLESIEDYKENVISFRKEFDSTEKLMKECQLKLGTGEFSFNYPNGKKYWSITFQGGLKQGPVHYYYPNGQLKTECNYLNDKLHGSKKTYYEDGTLSAEMNYVDGELNGKYISYYNNKQVKFVCNYQFDEKVGQSFYYYESGKVQSEYNYKNGLLNGPNIKYAETGELIIRRNFVHGNLESYQYLDKSGKLVDPILVKNETANIQTYYQNGVSAVNYSIVNGAIEGAYKCYYPNGKVAEESNLKCDNENGEQRTYYPSGQLESIAHWIEDVKYGTEIFYYGNGKVKAEYNYLNGERFGKQREFSIDGKLKTVKLYYSDEEQQ